MSYTREQILAAIQKAEAAGDAAAVQDLNMRLQDIDLQQLEPGAETAPPPPPEPSFMDKYGRIGAEMGGSLIGGALGAPGGLPGIMLGAGLGGEAAGTGYDYLTRATGGQAPQRTPQETVMGALFNTMGGPMPGPVRPPVASVDDAMYKAVTSRGGTLTPGQRGSGYWQRVEGALESSPFAGPMMDRQRGKAIDVFGDYIEDITPYASSRDVAGESAVMGMQNKADAAKAFTEAAYQKFDELLEAQGGDRLSRISAKALRALSDEYSALKARDPGFAELVFQDPDLARTLESVDQMAINAERNLAQGTNLPEAPTYDIIKRLRTLIGKKIDFNSPGSEQQGLKRLYRTLTDDLDEGAREIGGEAAFNQGKIADEMFAALKRDLETIDPVFKYAENPTQVYDALNRALRNNPELARVSRQAMGENAWNRFVDTWIRQNTAATGRGQNLAGTRQSPHVAFTRLQELKKQSPEGYALLTEGKGEALAVIEKLANQLKGGEEFINRSRTAGALGNQMLGFDPYLGGMGGLGGLAINTLQGGSGPTLPLVMGTVGAITRPIVAKLSAAVLTSQRLNNAMMKVGRTYDQIPVGKSLAKALIAAGADSQEVWDLFEDEEDVTPPLMEAGNAEPY